MRIFGVLALLLAVLIFVLSGCSDTQNAQVSGQMVDIVETTHAPREADFSTQLPEPTVSYIENNQEESVMKMKVDVNGTLFTATLEDNTAVQALVEMLEGGPVTIQMGEYGGFEKVGDLGASLPTSNRQVTTQSGDIVLYQGSQIVMFYGSNSWSYTRLGRIDDLNGWEAALGKGDVTVTLSLAM